MNVIRKMMIFSAQVLLSNPASAWVSRLLFQPIIWGDSHYSSKRCKQIPGWRLWASWKHYSPGWTQSWSLHGQHTGHSPCNGGGPQNHPAGKKSRVLKFQIFCSLGPCFCLYHASPHLCKIPCSFKTPNSNHHFLRIPTINMNLFFFFLNDHSTSSFLLQYLCQVLPCILVS